MGWTSTSHLYWFWWKFWKSSSFESLLLLLQFSISVVPPSNGYASSSLLMSTSVSGLVDILREKQKVNFFIIIIALNFKKYNFRLTEKLCVVRKLAEQIEHAFTWKIWFVKNIFFCSSFLCGVSHCLHFYPSSSEALFSIMELV